MTEIEKKETIETIKIAKTTDTKKCIWLNQKKQPCPWQTMSPSCDFCKRHSIYDGIYTKDDIQNLMFCSGCKNLFKNDDENTKICIKCKERGTENRTKTKEKNKIEKTICIGFTSTGTQCTYYSKENDTYCEKHQSYKKWKELTDNGKNVCTNWIRGCFETLNEGTKMCEKCRINERKNEKKRYENKKNKAIEFNDKNNKHVVENNNVNDGDNNTNNNDNKMCYLCNKIDKSTNFTNNKCLQCYNAYVKNETNRNTTEPIIKKLSDYKKSSQNRKIEWNLTDEQATKIMQSKCNYCDKIVVLNGIDRIDSDKNYIIENCVPCCKYCNIMKNTYTTEKFMKIVKYLLAINLYISEIPDENDKNLFEFSQNGLYVKFKCDAEQKNKNNELTEKMYNFIINQPCHYCKNSQSANTGCVGARGIDRIDSSTGYIIGNVVPCCKTCNYFKNDLTTENFFEHLKSIYNYKILNVNNVKLSIPEQIMQLCKDVKMMKPEKKYHEHEYYKELSFNYVDIEQVKKIKIELEFVKDKTQKDIWNYYRRHVSSLKKNENAKLIGRQIFILVKDKTTNKYLGILSLSSDIYNLEKRDNYIGWNHEDKKQKLDYIMNMSTCVPLQPFGFNFNGGKLLTSLIFSKEVLNYFKDKYEHVLLGITTTSLYGKSIQYDRLDCLKFLGYTKGNSIKDISPEVTKICSDYLKTEYNKNYPSRKKYLIIQHAFDKLNISKEDFLKSNEKGIYFGFTQKNAHEYLNGTSNVVPDIDNTQTKNTNEIFNWWTNRWAIQRFNNLKKNNLLKNE